MAAVESILVQAREPLSELALIRLLQKPPWSLVGDVDFSDPARLYPVHFLLFHVLYRLRDQLAMDGLTLQISPLRIGISRQSVVAGNGLPEREDALRRFYLDLEQYTLSDAHIQTMMDDFWTGREGARVSAPQAQQAAQTLGMNSIPTEFAPVKQRFRRAVMKAHPDRGGDTAEIQALNEAFATLRAYFTLRNHSEPR